MSRYREWGRATLIAAAMTAAVAAAGHQRASAEPSPCPVIKPSPLPLLDDPFQT